MAKKRSVKVYRAFEGEDDEQIAFEAAKTADLILSLITDDSPQVAEAECFSRIVNLGKPIICIMNVKASIAEDKSLKLALRDVNKRFDMDRLDKIRNQFLMFSEQFGQIWSHIPFVYIHLKSAYAALKAEDPEKSRSFYEVSRIDYLKRRMRTRSWCISMIRDPDILKQGLLVCCIRRSVPDGGASASLKDRCAQMPH